MIKYISHCAECPPIGKFDLPGGMRFHSKSNGQRFAKSSDSGSRPSASEIPLNATAYFPFGDCHGSSLISLTFTWRTEKIIWKPGNHEGEIKTFLDSCIPNF